MKKKFYAIRHGRQSGVVVGTWDECKKLTDGFAGAAFKGFAGHQGVEALQYARAGSCRPSQKKKGPKNPQSSWNQKLYPCVERKDYRDTSTGILYKNRCIRRRGPTIRGVDYKPHIGNSLPWHEADPEAMELEILAEARSRI